MHRNFRDAYDSLVADFKLRSNCVSPQTWQGTDVTTKPEMATHELEDVFFQFPVGTMDLNYHKLQIGPNLPWADDHFERDRVSGEPLNPGYTWEQWPYALKADNFRDKKGQFNHSYAERYWPKLAGMTDEGRITGTRYDLNETKFHTEGFMPKPDFLRLRDHHKGIRYPYGDLQDVVNLLVKNPLTRNAYLPVWFPEDTGVTHGGRTPCSIGYLFRLRKQRLAVYYDIRSCDFIRHFKDDVYLTIRLLLWVIEQCEMQDKNWKRVLPGNFSMHIGSFHIFHNDWKGFLDAHS